MFLPKEYMKTMLVTRNESLHENSNDNSVKSSKLCQINISGCDGHIMLTLKRS